MNPKSETVGVAAIEPARVITSTPDTLMVAQPAFVSAVLEVEELADDARIVGIAVRVETFLTALGVGLSAVVWAPP